MSDRKTRVFISYARADGVALANRLRDDLSNHGVEVWLDTSEIRGGETWTSAIEDEIDHADVILALLTHGSYRSEICRAEQLRSQRKGRCVIPVLADPGSDIPLHLEAKHHRDFTQASSYAGQFERLLGDIEERRGVPLPDEYRTTPVRYITAPLRVLNYIERADAIEALRDTLFTAAGSQPCSITAVVGMGGVGKTVLARAMCDNEVVQQAFPDGIVWLPTGRDPKSNVAARLREIGQALGDNGDAYTDAVASANRYRTMLLNKAALIIIDDVWSMADLEPFLAESPRSRFLFTTRDAAIARFIGAREYPVPLRLDQTQALELLALWSGTAREHLPPTAEDIIRQCDGLPGAIAMIGALLRSARSDEWTDILERLRTADLSGIAAQLPAGQESFFRTVEVSVKALTPKMQDQYASLAFLPQHMPASIPVLQCLWSVDDRAVRSITRQLENRSLLQSDSDQSAAVRLHDLQWDYLCAQYPDRRSLALIHDAVRLSLHAIEANPYEFATQLVGRLLPHRALPSIDAFCESLIQGAPRPWLRPCSATLPAPGGQLLQTLVGHQGKVSAIAVSADGCFAVSQSIDEKGSGLSSPEITLKVWELENGREVATARDHSHMPGSVAISRDGHRVVSGSMNGTLAIWDVERGQDGVVTIPGCYGSHLLLSADGLRALSSFDRALKVWDVKSGNELATLGGHHDIPLAISQDGRSAMSVADDGTLKVWNLQTCREEPALGQHAKVVHVAFSENGRRAVSSSPDGTLKFWDLEHRQELATVRGHWTFIYSLAVSRDGRRAVSASADRTLKVWDLDRCSELETLSHHTDTVTAVAIAPDGRRALSGSKDWTLKIWNLDSRAAAFTPRAHKRRVSGVALSDDERRMISVSWDGDLKFWEGDGARELRSQHEPSGGVMALALTPDSRRAVIACADHTLKILDGRTGQVMTTLRGHIGEIFSVALSADGRWAISGSEDCTLRIWDLRRGDQKPFTIENLRAYSVAIGDDGRRAVAACDGSRLVLLDMRLANLAAGSVDADEALQQWGMGTYDAWAVAITPNGQRALSGYTDGTLQLWDLRRGVELARVRRHTDKIHGVTVSHDGQLAVSTSQDRTLRVWSLEPLEQLAQFSTDAALWACSLARDNKTVVVGDDLGHIHVLRLEGSP